MGERAVAFRAAWTVRDGGKDPNGFERETRDFAVGLHGVESIDVAPGLVTIIRADGATRHTIYVTPMGAAHMVSKGPAALPAKEQQSGKRSR